MSITTSLLAGVFLAFLAAVIWVCKVGFRRRWSALSDQGLVVYPDSIKDLDVQRVVTIDLGYGNETWLLTTQQINIDRASRVINDAFVLHPSCQFPEKLRSLEEAISVRF
jgi:hypothetical protein